MTAPAPTALLPWLRLLARRLRATGAGARRWLTYRPERAYMRGR